MDLTKTSFFLCTTTVRCLFVADSTEDKYITYHHLAKAVTFFICSVIYYTKLIIFHKMVPFYPTFTVYYLLSFNIAGKKEIKSTRNWSTILVLFGPVRWYFNNLVQVTNVSSHAPIEYFSHKGLMINYRVC